MRRTLAIALAVLLLGASPSLAKFPVRDFNDAGAELLDRVLAGGPVVADIIGFCPVDPREDRWICPFSVRYRLEQGGERYACRVVAIVRRDRFLFPAERWGCPTRWR